jgi:hypothetical protein
MPSKCPGKKVKIGDATAGGCRRAKLNEMSFCSKHQMPCRNGCPNAFHMITDEGCLECDGNRMAEERLEKNAKKEQKKAEKDKEMNDFLNPTKDRKKPAGC